MGRTALAALLVCLVLVVAGCTPGTTSRTRERRGGPVPLPSRTPGRSVIIEVFGTEGLKFGGAYGDSSAVQHVEGTVPMRLTFETYEGFVVNFQKRVAQGELGIRITLSGRQVARSSTLRPFGSVVHRQGASR